MAAGSATLSSLPTFGPDGELHVVIETPKGSRHKYAYEPDLKTFKLKTVLPEGLSFPYDFGMVPSTKGEDGDPLDVLLLLDAPAFAGCLIAARLIGVVEADQRERDETWERNDRLVAVSLQASTHTHIRSLDDLRPGMLDEVEAFFAQYNALSGREFRPRRRGDADAARALVRDGARAAEASA